MRYIELNESREGNLYHWIQIEYLPEIYEKNKLSAKWTHLFPPNQKIIGRSFSRNPRFTFNAHERLLLVFDYGKLSTNNKIIPLDAERVFYYGYDNLDWDKAKSGDIDFKIPTNPKKLLRRGTRELNTQFDEEFVIGDIKNVSKKLRYVIQAAPIQGLRMRTTPKGAIVQDFRIWCITNNIRYYNLSKEEDTFKKLPLFHKEKRKK